MTMTAEQKAIKKATEKIEKKYAKLAKRRFAILNQIVAPDKDLLDMTDADFNKWALPLLQAKNPKAHDSLVKQIQRKKKRAVTAKRKRHEAKQQVSDDDLQVNNDDGNKPQFKQLQPQRLS